MYLVVLIDTILDYLAVFSTLHFLMYTLLYQQIHQLVNTLHSQYSLSVVFRRVIAILRVAIAKLFFKNHNGLAVFRVRLKYYKIKIEITHCHATKCAPMNNISGFCIWISTVYKWYMCIHQHFKHFNNFNFTNFILYERLCARYGF